MYRNHPLSMNYLNTTHNSLYKNKNISVKKSSSSRLNPPINSLPVSSSNTTIGSHPSPIQKNQDQQFVEVYKEIQKKSNSQHYSRGFISGASLAMIMFVIVTASFPVISNIGLAAIACIIMVII